MEYIAKGISTVAIWIGIIVLSYLFNSFNILDGHGAAAMVLGAFLCTGFVWKPDIFD